MDHILQRKKKTIPFNVIDECVNIKQKIEEQLNSSSNTNRIQNYILKQCFDSKHLFYLQINFDFIKEGFSKIYKSIFRFNSDEPETTLRSQKYILSKDQVVYDDISYHSERIYIERIAFLMKIWIQLLFMRMI